eukprot:6178845-Pleurochrysis_carterae.AAC.1
MYILLCALRTSHFHRRACTERASQRRQEEGKACRGCRASFHGRFILAFATLITAFDEFRPHMKRTQLFCMQMPGEVFASLHRLFSSRAFIILCVAVQRIYIVATCDKDLKRRLRKIPGVPLISIKERKYQVERMPEGQFG